MDPFHDIDSLVDEDVTLVASNLNAVCQLNVKELDVYRRVTDEQDDDEEDVWDPENQPKSAFDIFSRHETFNIDSETYGGPFYFLI